MGDLVRLTVSPSMDQTSFPQCSVGSGLSAGVWPIYAGHAHALTFASQLTNVETIRSERTFGQICGGLQVYGRQVLAS